MKPISVIVLVLSMLTITSCSIIKKNKEIKREKVETSQIQKAEVNLEAEKTESHQAQFLTENQLISLLSSINWSYAGKDSAEIEIIQTAQGIKIKTKGTATADFKANSESELNKTETKSETKSETNEKINLKVDSESEFKSETKSFEKEKDVKRFDFSAWWWIIVLILAIIALVLYWFFGRPRKLMDL